MSVHKCQSQIPFRSPSRRLLRSSTGMALIQVLVAAGLLTIVALGAASVMVDMSKSANTNRQRNQMESLHEEIRALLSSRQSCMNTVGAINLNALVGTNLAALTAIRDNSNQIRFQTFDPSLNNVYGDRTTRLASIDVGGFTAGVDAGGELTMRIRYTTAVEMFGAQEVIRTINLSTTRDVATGILQTCLAMAKMSDGLWQRSTANVNDIFYNGRNVGVGTASPEQRLHVMGPDPTGIAIESSNGNNPALAFVANGGMVPGNANGGIAFMNRQVTGPTNPINPLWGSSLAIIQPLFTSNTATSGAHLMFVVKENNGPPLERMRLTSDGRLGINTSTPLRTLHVVGDAAIGNMTNVVNADGEGPALEIGGSTSINSDPISLYRNNFGPNRSELRVLVGDDPNNGAWDRMTIGSFAAASGGTWTPHVTFTTLGRIGLNTDEPEAPIHSVEPRQNNWVGESISSASEWDSPGFIGIRFRGSLGARSTALLDGDRIAHFYGAPGYTNWSDLGPLYAFTGIGVHATENHSTTNRGSGLRFYTTPNGSTQTFPHPRMVIHGNGQVGINTQLAEPRTLLEVQNDEFWSLATMTVISNADPKHTGGAISLRGRGTRAIPQYPVLNDLLGHFAGRDIIDGYTNNRFGGAEIFVMAAQNFSVNAKGSHLIFATTANNAVTTAERMRLTEAGELGIGTPSPSERLHVVGNLRVQGMTDCTLGNGAGGTSCSSDRRLKTEIAPISDPLEKIQRISGVEFTWNKLSSQPGRKGIGVIAQDVEASFPTAVMDDPATGMKKVDYAVLVAPLIEAVKALCQRLLDLFARVDDQSRQIQALQDELEQQRQKSEAMRQWICQTNPAAPFCKD